ncbi:MAG: GNAT family N-acetyltransferase [bacterium]|nr:GNAT family N-acetyltransferase [bacterium]
MIKLNYRLRLANIEDIPVLVKHHRLMFEEINELENNTASFIYSDLDKSYTEKLKAQLPNGLCRAYVIEYKNKVVASGAVTIAEYVPIPEDTNTKIARIHSVYTDKEHRRKGLAKQIMEALISICKEPGIRRIRLVYSNEAQQLYEKLGFKPMTNSLELFIKEDVEVDKIIIQKATLENAQEILSLQKSAYQTEAQRYNNFCIEPLKQTLEEMKQDIQEQIVLKAVIDNKIIGSVRAYQKENDVCYIGRLVVHQDYRRKGIAKKLMREIETMFPKVKSFSLFTGWKSRENINLYMSLGYYPTRIEAYDEKDKMVFMEKIIK